MKTKKIPLRKCLGCNEQFDKRSLIRVVRNNEGKFSVDFTGKLNGRGAYICKKKECFDMAIKKNSLSRAFQEKIPDDVLVRLKEEFETHEG
jgi:predicted RNA-binding protein YlxR (DUF448 family)